MAKPTKRDGWRCVGGKWTRSAGERGTRVRLFQKRRNGTFYRAVWVRGQGHDRACLHTHDREEADRLGRQLLAALFSGEGQNVRSSRVTLKDLWERFKVESLSFLDNHPRTKDETEVRAKVLLAFFGEDCDVRHLTARDQAAYTTQRMAGGIRYAEDRVTQKVRARSVEADLVLLHAMLAWATTVRVPGGGRLLEYNPLFGVRRVRELNPKRPVATWERFHKTRVAIQALQVAAESEAECTRWTRLELALVLAEATGRRLGSIRQLRWEDIDFHRPTIRWRAEADKKGREWVIPVPASLLEELKQFRRKLGAVGGWLFAADHNPERPMDRHLFDRWLMVAEGAAKLPKLEGGLWHPYRRKWATERKGHSLKDVAAAGGWQDTETLLKCYQQPDNETLLAVMSEERKLREVGADSR
jgi:integrase